MLLEPFVRLINGVGKCKWSNYYWNIGKSGQGDIMNVATCRKCLFTLNISVTCLLNREGNKIFQGKKQQGSVRWITDIDKNHLVNYYERFHWRFSIFHVAALMSKANMSIECIGSYLLSELTAGKLIWYSALCGWNWFYTHCNEFPTS